MKEKIIKFVNEYKKYVIISGVGLGLVLLGLISWKLIFSRYKIFFDNEAKFRNAAKRYYEYHKQALPKDGESKTLTLQDLYDLDQISDLYVPKTRKMCDTASWVRVYKDKDGEYKYATYLKCGRYHSRGDHEGPEIILKGKTNISVALNSEYKELGVKSVIDNKDKEIDVKKVTIDSSKVNTKKIGTYEVTYTVKDSKYNETVVKRYVEVVKGLTDTVKASTASDGYYKGNSKNYVLFSGMLWQILKVNEDGTVKIILDQPLANLRFNHDKYKDSNIDKWLKNVFYDALTNPKKYLVSTNYCVGNINSMEDYGSYCDSSIERYVGLLDINEYKKSFEGEASSIQSRSFALAHKIGDNYADAGFAEKLPTGIKTTILAPIRPVVTLKNSLKIVSGDGSNLNPYKLDDYDYAEKTDKIKTRLVGEYVDYSGMKFRIIGKDEDNNVRLIMSNVWKVQPNDTNLYISTEKLDKWKFDLNDENNPGYIINNDYLDYIDTKNIVKTTYEIPTNDAKLTYDKYKTKKVTAKVLLPKTYELFSSVGESKYMYLYIDKAVDNQMLFSINSSTSRVFEFNKTDYTSYTLKTIITIKGNMRIESGNGTINNPYKLK